VPSAAVALRGDPVDRLCGLEMSAVTLTLLFLALAEAFRQPMLQDVAVALAIMSFGGGLVFARFLERWL
jgi:multicomponent Na+:H+ antiporter subunit F